MVLPSSAWSLGLWSNESTWERPPVSVTMMRLVARAAKWGARGVSSPPPSRSTAEASRPRSARPPASSAGAAGQESPPITRVAHPHGSPRCQSQSVSRRRETRWSLRAGAPRWSIPPHPLRRPALRPRDDTARRTRSSPRSRRATGADRRRCERRARPSGLLRASPESDGARTARIARARTDCSSGKATVMGPSTRAARPLPGSDPGRRRGARRGRVGAVPSSGRRCDGRSHTRRRTARAVSNSSWPEAGRAQRPGGADPGRPRPTAGRRAATRRRAAGGGNVSTTGRRGRPRLRAGPGDSKADTPRRSRSGGASP